MADWSTLLNDRSWATSAPGNYEQQLKNLAQSLQALGIMPGTPEYETAFYSLVSMVSGSTVATADDIYGSSTGNLALKNYMNQQVNYQERQELGLKPTGQYGFGPDIGGWYSSTGEYIPANDPYQRNNYGQLVLKDDGTPYTMGEYSVTEFYKGIYGRSPTAEELADGLAGLDSPQGYRRFFINTYGREPNEDELAQGLGTGKYANVGSTAGITGSGFGSTGSTGSALATPLTAEQKEAKSAYDLLFEQFNQYGMGALVEPLKKLITEGISSSEFTIRLRDTDAYKKRFAANQSRIQKGLRALSEAEYIGLEDQYQDVMRRYGLPESYYTRGDMGRQEGFEKFIAGDVSPVELEDRIQTAQNRVVNAAPEVSRALREFYPDITNGDILAYALDPSKAIENIKRKVTAAEIGAGAMQAGLATGLARAEELRSYGVTGDQARQGYQAIGSLLPRASTLGDIYSKQGMGAYTQTTAEAEIFGTPGAIEAEKKRRQLAQLETASFSGSSGAAGGALARERAGQF